MTRKQWIHALKRQQQLKKLALLAAATTAVGAVSLANLGQVKAEEVTDQPVTTEVVPDKEEAQEGKEEKVTTEDSTDVDGQAEPVSTETAVNMAEAVRSDDTGTRTSTQTEKTVTFIKVVAEGKKGEEQRISVTLKPGESYAFSFDASQLEPGEGAKLSYSYDEVTDTDSYYLRLYPKVEYERPKEPEEFEYVEWAKDSSGNHIELKRETRTINPGETLVIQPEEREGYVLKDSRALTLHYTDVKRIGRSWGTAAFGFEYIAKDAPKPKDLFPMEFYDEAKARELYKAQENLWDLVEKAMVIDPDDYTTKSYEQTYPTVSLTIGQDVAFYNIQSILILQDTARVSDREFKPENYKVWGIEQYDHYIKQTLADASVLERALKGLVPVQKVGQPAPSAVEPEKPVTPPTAPEKPVQPVAPTTPEKPVEPITPEKPTPTQPTTPLVVEPEKPVQPVAPTTTDKPLEPTTPVQPTTPATPQADKDEEKNPAPAGQTTTNKPVGAVGGKSPASGKPATKPAVAQSVAAKPAMTEKASPEQALPQTGEVAGFLSAMGFGLLGLVAHTKKWKR